MFGKAFKKPPGISEPTTVEIHGRPLNCLVCGHDTFWRRTTQKNTAFLTFLKLDWMNRTVTSLACDKCGYVHEFFPTKK